LLAGIFMFNILRIIQFSSPVWGWIALLPLTLADNAALVPSQLVRVGFMVPGSSIALGTDIADYPFYVLALLAFIPCYIWMIGGVLRWAERRIITQGALR
jgi:hypothetical protein